MSADADFLTKFLARAKFRLLERYSSGAPPKITAANKFLVFKACGRSAPLDKVIKENIANRNKNRQKSRFGAKCDILDLSRIIPVPLRPAQFHELSKMKEYSRINMDVLHLENELLEQQSREDAKQKNH